MKRKPYLLEGPVLSASIEVTTALLGKASDWPRRSTGRSRCLN